MVKHLDYLRANVDMTAVKATGETRRMAIAVTTDEVITAHVGLLGKWGSKIKRYPLASLTDFQLITGPSSNFLQFEFSGLPPRSLTVMYEPAAETDFARIVDLVQPRVRRPQKKGV